MDSMFGRDSIKNYNLEKTVGKNDLSQGEALMGKCIRLTTKKESSTLQSKRATSTSPMREFQAPQSGKFLYFVKSTTKMW